MSDIVNEPLLGSIKDLKTSIVHVDATVIWKKSSKKYILYTHIHKHSIPSLDRET